jgi:hypothetical protein
MWLWFCQCPDFNPLMFSYFLQNKHQFPWWVIQSPSQSDSHWDPLLGLLIFLASYLCSVFPNTIRSLNGLCVFPILSCFFKCCSHCLELLSRLKSLAAFIIIFQDSAHLFCEVFKVNYFLPLETFKPRGYTHAYWIMIDYSRFICLSFYMKSSPDGIH